MLLLLIETSTEICSVALAHNGKIIAIKESSDGFSHAKNLILFIDSILQENLWDKRELSAIGLSIGPGSYTGLRIGASTAKGLAYALDIPVVTVPTLLGIMMGAKQDYPAKNFLFCPMIDARRMEVYTALYDYNGQIIEDVNSLIINENTFDELLSQQTVIFCGNGMPKCKALLAKYERAHFSDRPVSAINLLQPSLEKFYTKEFEDVAYFEPFYLKEFIAVKSKVKGLE